MSVEQPHVPIETLLAHRHWVRRLARSLVRDDAAADDLEQRTWHAALRFPPQRVASARAWLSRVVRNLAKNEHRSEGRRVGHERAGRRAGTDRPAAEIVAETESHGRLVRAVLDLDDPYRSTLLLRYFEDLPPRKIAERLGTPVETVRTRVRRGVALLRERLGGGAGNAWLAPLLPLIGARIEVGASAATVAAVTGGTIMTAKVTMIAAVGVALAAGFLGGALSGAAVAPTAEIEIVELRRRISALEAECSEFVQAGVHRERMERHRAESDLRIGALEAELETVRTKGDRVPDAMDGGEAAKVIEAKLQRWRGLSTQRLLAEAERLTRHSQRTEQPKDVRNAMAVCQVALERELEVDQRAKVLIHQGQVHSVVLEYKLAEASYLQAIQVAGEGSAMGITAAQSLAHTALRQDDYRTAADWFTTVVKQPDAPLQERTWCRYRAAGCFQQGGEPVRAIAEYKAIIAEFDGSEDPGVRRVVGFCRKELERLER